MKKNIKSARKTGKSYDLAKLAEALKKAKPVFHEPRGNSKLGQIPAWNIAPVATCSPEACKTCAKEGCYAVKNMFMAGYDYDTNNCLKAWTDNTVLVKEELDAFYDKMMAYLNIMEMSLSACKFFRIHSAGDFFSEEYAWAWYALAKSHPGIKFLAFTKQFDIVRNVPFYELDNFSLVLSGWTGLVIPEDLKEHYRCAYCVEKGMEAPAGCYECPGNCDTCGMCWNLKKLGIDTFFHKH